jgi:hypothetical protein
MGKVTVIDALKEHYDMLKDAYKKGANLAPCDFEFIAEYEKKYPTPQREIRA